jgi:hypothetical protein
VSNLCTASCNVNRSCPHSVFMCFVWISDQTAITSLYSINWLVFITETQCVYCAVRIWSSCKAQWFLYVPPGLTFANSTFCPHSAFMCFVWISEQTAIISLCSINWQVFRTETQCVYCAVGIWSSCKAQWLLYVPPALTFNNSTFCPHSIYVFGVDLRTMNDYFPIQY